MMGPPHPGVRQRSATSRPIPGISPLSRPINRLSIPTSISSGYLPLPSSSQPLPRSASTLSCSSALGVPAGTIFPRREAQGVHDGWRPTPPLPSGAYPIDSYRPTSSASMRLPPPQPLPSRSSPLDSQPRTPQEIMMADMQQRKPAADKILEALAGLAQQVGNLQTTCSSLQGDQRNLRDQIHELQTNQKALPTRDDIVEELNLQLPALLEAAMQPVSENNNPTPSLSTEEVAAAVVSGLKVEMRDTRDIMRQLQDSQQRDTGRRSPMEESTAKLMSHLILRLDSVHELVDSLRGLDGLAEAIVDVQVCKQALDALPKKDIIPPHQIEEDSHGKMRQSQECSTAGNKNGESTSQDSAQDTQSDDALARLFGSVTELQRSINDSQKRNTRSLDAQQQGEQLRQLCTDVSEIRYDLKALKSTVERLESTYNPLTTRLSSHESDFSELKTSINDIKKVMAQLPPHTPFTHLPPTPRSVPPRLGVPRTRGTPRLNPIPRLVQGVLRFEAPPTPNPDVFGPMQMTSDVPPTDTATGKVESSQSSATQTSKSASKSRKRPASAHPPSTSTADETLVGTNTRKRKKAKTSTATDASTTPAGSAPSRTDPKRISAPRFFDGPCARTRSSQRRSASQSTGTAGDSIYVSSGSDVSAPKKACKRSALNTTTSSSSSDDRTPSNYSSEERAQRREASRKKNIGKKASHAKKKVTTPLPNDQASELGAGEILKAIQADMSTPKQTHSALPPTPTSGPQDTTPIVSPIPQRPLTVPSREFGFRFPTQIFSSANHWGRQPSTAPTGSTQLARTDSSLATGTTQPNTVTDTTQNSAEGQPLPGYATLQKPLSPDHYSANRGGVARATSSANGTDAPRRLTTYGSGPRKVATAERISLWDAWANDSD